MEYVKSVLDRMTNLKKEIDGVMVNAVIATKWNRVVESVHRRRECWLEKTSVDILYSIGEANRVNEEILWRFDIKKTEAKGQMLVNFAKRKEMALANKYFN